MGVPGLWEEWELTYIVGNFPARKAVDKVHPWDVSFCRVLLSKGGSIQRRRYHLPQFYFPLNPWDASSEAMFIGEEVALFFFHSPIK